MKNRVDNHSPQHILHLGYARLHRENGNGIVTTASALKKGEKLNVMLHDGCAAVEVQDVRQGVKE